LDPLSPIIGSSLGEAYIYAHRYDEAIQQLNKVSESNPDFAYMHCFVSSAYFGKHLYKEAIEQGVLCSQLGGDPYGLEAMKAAQETFRTSGLKAAYLKATEIQLSQRKKTYISPYGIAAGFAIAGEKDKAFAWLQTAYDERDQAICFLKVDPAMDALHGDLRFATMLKKIGLQP